MSRATRPVAVYGTEAQVVYPVDPVHSTEGNTVFGAARSE